MYKVFPTRTDNFLDALGMGQIFPWRHARYREFWALRGIDLDLREGKRIGIIGRNGAGKTTMLKLITGNIPVTEGTLKVRGQVQALLDSGGGLHPEFTGYENIRAALTYQGLGRKEIVVAEADIVEFTELGEFLDQPFKNYSLGMQARLAFAIATSIRPEILIVDEVLGAGDAYFFTKSTARMTDLVEGGASVLMVSHALDHIIRFCDNAMWLDRGRIVMRGETLDVVKAYEQYIHELEDRRLRAKNRKVRSAEYAPHAYEAYADRLLVRLTLNGDHGGYCDIAEVTLIRNGQAEDQVALGGPQDSDTSQSSFLVAAEVDVWASPALEEGKPFRRLEQQDGGPVSGSVIFYLYAFLEDSEYAVELRYRSGNQGQLTLEVLKNGQVEIHEQLPPAISTWRTHRLALPRLARVGPTADPGREGAAVALAEPPANERVVTRWPGEGSLTIENVALVDSQGEERAVFEAGTEATLELEIVATRSGVFPVVPAAVLFRLDGVLVSRFIGDDAVLDLMEGERREARLRLAPLNLGNGHYVYSVALYRKLDLYDIAEPEIYDLIDRSYEFQVIGVPPLKTGIFQHPGDWQLG